MKVNLDAWHSVDKNVQSMEISKGMEAFEKYKNLKDHLNHKNELYMFLDRFSGKATVDDISKIESLIESYKEYSGQTYKVPKSHITMKTDWIEPKYPMLSLLDDHALSGGWRSTPDAKKIKTIASYVNSIG